MHRKLYILVGAGLVSYISAVDAAVIDITGRPPSEAQVAAKTASRSFSGFVQAVEAGGVIRLREQRQGDVRVIITNETSLTKGDDAAQLRDIRVGSRIHGMASFRGGKYYAKVIHLD